MADETVTDGSDSTSPRPADFINRLSTFHPSVHPSFVYGDEEGQKGDESEERKGRQRRLPIARSMEIMITAVRGA